MAGGHIRTLSQEKVGEQKRKTLRKEESTIPRSAKRRIFTTEGTVGHRVRLLI
jgi:hypothetical protein